MPAGDHQEIRLAENAVKNADCQFRVIKEALESGRGRRARGEHQVVFWIVMHAASVVNQGRHDEEGFSAHRRWRGRWFAKPVAEVGECALYPAMSAGRDKFDARWRERERERRSVVGGSHGG